MLPIKIKKTNITGAYFKHKHPLNTGPVKQVKNSLSTWLSLAKRNFSTLD